MNALRDESNIDGSGPDFMSGMVEDLETIPKNERLGRAARLKRKKSRKRLLLAAAGVIVLVVVWAMAFDGGTSSREVETALNASLLRIKDRLKVLEDKLAQFEERMNADSRHGKAASTEVRARQDYHIVQPGDSLSAIAAKYGLTVDVLCKLNRIKVEDPIKPDQWLLVSPN